MLAVVSVACCRKQQWCLYIAAAWVFKLHQTLAKLHVAVADCVLLLSACCCCHLQPSYTAGLASAAAGHPQALHAGMVHKPVPRVYLRK